MKGQTNIESHQTWEITPVLAKGTQSEAKNELSDV